MVADTSAQGRQGQGSGMRDRNTVAASPAFATTRRNAGDKPPAFLQLTLVPIGSAALPAVDLLAGRCLEGALLCSGKRLARRVWVACRRTADSGRARVVGDRAVRCGVPSAVPPGIHGESGRYRQR